jgi:hypothetical protein
MEKDLTVGDINLAVNIIDLAAKRGAFQTEEFELIGKLTNKFRAFIEELAAPKETEELENIENGQERED